MNYFSVPEKQYSLNLEVSEPHRLFSYWVKKLHEDSFYRSVIESDAFRRLKKISFLGAIDYLPYESHLKKAPRSRAEHSEHVAALAYFVATQRGYSKELTRHLVVAGLLHDIGHPPLSHSVEPYLKQHFGFGHHEMGQMLLKGEQQLGKKLTKILEGKLDLTFIDQLIAGQVAQELGGDLFSSPINIDTIDGILRTLSYYSKPTMQVRPLEVAYASFIQTDPKRFDLLDDFWELKQFVYKNIINRPQGVLADQYSQVYFLNEPDLGLDETSLFDSERQWKSKFKSLFDSLKSIHSIKNEFDKNFLVSVPIVERSYYTRNSDNPEDRFKTKKIKTQISISSIIDKELSAAAQQKCIFG